MGARGKMLGFNCRNGFLYGCCSDHTKKKARRHAKRAERRQWKMEAQVA